MINGLMKKVVLIEKWIKDVENYLYLLFTTFHTY